MWDTSKERIVDANDREPVSGHSERVRLRSSSAPSGNADENVYGDVLWFDYYPKFLINVISMQTKYHEILVLSGKRRPSPTRGTETCGEETLT